jgi:hypothetical protein
MALVPYWIEQLSTLCRIAVTEQLLYWYMHNIWISTVVPVEAADSNHTAV